MLFHHPWPFDMRMRQSMSSGLVFFCTSITGFCCSALPHYKGQRAAGLLLTTAMLHTMVGNGTLAWHYPNERGNG